MSKIEYTDETLNPIRSRDVRSSSRARPGWFCTKVSPGCKNCYSENLNGFRGNGLRYAADQEQFAGLFLDEKTLAKPLRWRRPRKIFWCDMTDMFHPLVKDEWLRLIFRVMRETPQHTHIILTKRPERMKTWSCLGHASLQHVWAGTSVENQETADQRIPHLLATPAYTRWISAEPLLGPVSLDAAVCDWWESRYQPLWVVCGGESGPKARPMHPGWARSLRDQCVAAGVPFFFKQWGAWGPTGSDIQFQRKRVHTWGVDDPHGAAAVARWGKKAAGRLLDGREWNEFPGAGDIAPGKNERGGSECSRGEQKKTTTST
jgi:protein gp37